MRKFRERKIEDDFDIQLHQKEEGIRIANIQRKHKQIRRKKKRKRRSTSEKNGKKEITREEKNNGIKSDGRAGAYVNIGQIHRKKNKKAKEQGE